VVIAVLSFETAVFVGICIYTCRRLTYEKCQSVNSHSTTPSPRVVMSPVHPARVEMEMV
jgi:hypothetical protein